MGKFMICELYFNKTVKKDYDTLCKHQSKESWGAYINIRQNRLQSKEKDKGTHI